MGDRHDYVALEWVKGEIAETLKQARQALESFVENPQDPTRMRFCLAYVHQVHGTLQMVEFYGAALLAEEMEQLAQALMDGRAANQGEALEVLMQAILQLPVYLDRVQSARRDLPLVVMPLLNDLRAARGENLLSETSLFVPDLSGRLPALPVESLEQLRTAELPVLLRKLRQMLQMALVGVIRNQDLATNLGYMARVFARLETLCKDAPLGALWQVASGLVEGLANGSIVNGTSVRTLLRQVDRELKRLVSQGADGINQAAPDELAKNMLFYVAKAPAQSPRIRALKQQYRLEDALPDTDVVDEERARLAGPDRDAMRSVVGALCEELVRIKDSLDLFVRSDRSQVAELDSQLAPLKQIADTLAVLGFGQPRKVILDQIDVIHGLTLGQQEPSDALLMDVAGALLYVEATLAGMVAPSEQAASEQSHLPTTDVAQVHQLVIKEARNGLEQAKDAIIEFIASQWNHDHLARVPELLTQVRGGLAMIPLLRAATLLNACNRYIQEQLLVRKVVPNWQHLDTLADAITSVEYYLERLSEDHASQGDLILDVAEESLESLGYPMKERPSILDVEPIAPLADPLQDLEVLAAEEIHYEAPAEPLPEPDDEGLVLSDAQGEPAVELLANDDNWSQGEESFGEEPEIIDFSLDQPLEADEKLHAPLEALGTFEVLPAEERDVLAEDAGLDALSDSAVNWDDLELSELDLPQVELSTTPFESVREEAEPGATADTSLSMADVMAAPAQAINPPAQFIPLSLLPPPADEEPVDGELLEVFVEEAGEVLETIAQYLPRWTTDVSDQEALTEVRRAFHTLKGSGRMVRALVIGELAWSIENLLNRVLDRSIEAGERVLNVIGDVVAVMPELVDEFAARAQRQRDDVDRLAAIAHALARGETPPDESGAADDLADEEALPELEAIDVAAPEQASGTDGLDPQLLEIFRNEAEAHLDALVGFLADCTQELPQPVTDDLQRALHTLKGSASMAGILPIAEIATPLEKLFKEYKTNLIDVDLIEAELLHTAEQLFRQGLEQLDTTPLAPIEGAAELLERAQTLHQERLDNIETQRQDSPAPGRDPQMLATFLADGMDTLLDAEDLLRRWREYPVEQQELSVLFEELDTLGRSACLAELPQIDALCQPLRALYTLVQDGRLAVSDRFFTEAEAAHEALMSMMDQLAAGLEVVPQPERVAALQALMDEAFDPGAQAVEVPLSADDAGFHDGEVASTLEPEPELTDIPRTSMPESLDREMVAIFLEEAVDILESAGKALERQLADPDNGLALSSLQRDLHTLKGGARMAEIGAIGDLAHELESLYEGLVDRRFNHSPQLSQLLQQSHDRLALLLEQLQHGQPLADSSDLIAAIRLFREGGGQEPPPGLSVDSTQGWDDPAEPVVDSGWLLDAENAHDLQNQPESLAEPPPPAEPPDAETSETDDWQLAAQAPEIVEEAQHQAPGPVGDAWTSEPPAPPAVDDRDPELVEIFLEEGFDIMDSSAAALHRWMEDVDNTLEVEALQRDLHTLKGGARMAEISEIGDLAHELEFLYEGVGDGRLRANADLFSLLQACHDRLAEMLEAVRDQRAVPDGQALIQTIRQFRANPDAQLNVPSSVHLQRLEDSRREQDEDAEADILDIFLEEADDLLEAMETSLGHWDASREDAGAIDDMLRILHTLKGGAQLAGQKRLGDMTHDLEQHLSEAQQRGAPWPESLLLDVQSGFDGLQKELGELRLRLGETQAEDAAALAVQVEREMEAEPIGVTPVTLRTPLVASSTQAPVQQESRVLPFVQRAAAAAQEASARRAPQELVKVPADLLEGLVNLAGETSIFRGRVEQQVSDVGFTLGEMDATIDRVRDQLRRLDTETQAQILSRYQAETEKAGYEDFDPLEMDRYSQLQQLSRALFESASDLLDLKETLALRYRDAETLLLQQARVNTELQEGLMRTRMVPFDRLVPRLRRIVRQTASELGKQVEFAVGNAEGEMDRTVLERIVAPLEHMLRNAVDHGIEPVETRRANGKSDVGTIRLTLGREGGDILITLGDDGGGIKLEAVRRKAIERGLMDADADLSDYETLQFILEPGFSTAEKVTQISGRGVGMDVVHSEVKQLGGSMSIESTVGEGTRFLIRLPFTVSVNRALMVLSGEDLYAIPLNTIEGIVRVSPYELEDLYQQGIDEDGQPLTPRFEYAGQPYELKYLGDLLNNGQQPKLVGQSLPLPVILVRSSEHTVAVQVDSLAGSREIVVKSLGPQFAGVHGISGATILGDGRVVVILDLAATIRGLHAHQQMLIHAPRLAGHAPVDTEQDAERPTLVMVVDDSVTVRKVTSRLLERNGMNVMTAKDGVDAISQLQEQMPDIMLLDIEMPRMDGFEVATLVRHDDRLKDLPIIMITSRTGDKHRERAMAIGVNQYLGKPYQESDLLENIDRLVMRHD